MAVYWHVDAVIQADLSYKGTSGRIDEGSDTEMILRKSNVATKD